MPYPYDDQFQRPALGGTQSLTAPTRPTAGTGITVDLQGRATPDLSGNIFGNISNTRTTVTRGAPQITAPVLPESKSGGGGGGGFVARAGLDAQAQVDKMQETPAIVAPVDPVQSANRVFSRPPQTNAQQGQFDALRQKQEAERANLLKSGGGGGGGSMPDHMQSGTESGGIRMPTRYATPGQYDYSDYYGSPAKQNPTRDAVARGSAASSEAFGNMVAGLGKYFDVTGKAVPKPVEGGGEGGNSQIRMPTRYATPGQYDYSDYYGSPAKQNPTRDAVARGSAASSEAFGNMVAGLGKYFDVTGKAVPKPVEYPPLNQSKPASAVVQPPAKGNDQVGSDWSQGAPNAMVGNAQPITAPTDAASQPTAQAKQTITAPTLQSTVPYQPMTRTVGKDGTIQITGSGQSPEYLARMQAEGRDQAGNIVPPKVAAQVDWNAFKTMGAYQQKMYLEFAKATAHFSDAESRERTALIGHAMSSADNDVRIKSAEKIAEMNAKALNKQVDVVQIREEKDPSDITGMTKTKIFGLKIIGPDGNGMVTELDGTPIKGSTAPIREASKSAIEFLKRNPDTKEEFRKHYGYLPKDV